MYKLKLLQIITLFLFFNITFLRAEEVVLVVGGSGLTGWETVKEAINNDYKVKATTTNLKKAKKKYGEVGFKWIKVDVRVLDDIRDSMEDVDYLISTIGGSCYDPGGPSSSRHIDYQGVVNLVGVAKDYGVKQIILTSSINAGIPEVKLNELCDNIYMWKWLGEDYLRDSGIKYTIVRPGGLGIGEGGKEYIKLADSRGHKTGSMQRSDLAKVLVGVIGNINSYGKTIEVVAQKINKIQNWKKQLKLIPIDPPQSSPLGSK